MEFACMMMNEPLAAAGACMMPLPTSVAALVVTGFSSYVARLAERIAG
jgi:hypothetical protein